MINKCLIQFSASVALTIGAVFSAPAISAPWFSSLVPALKRQTSLPILLPSSLSPIWQNTYPTVEVDKDGYVVYLGSEQNCNGTRACTAGYITGSKLKLELTGREQKVKLAKGITGFFTPKNCPGQACYPAYLSWVYQDNTYGLVGIEDRAPLVNLANSAITGGPR